MNQAEFRKKRIKLKDYGLCKKFVSAQKKVESFWMMEFLKVKIQNHHSVVFTLEVILTYDLTLLQ